MMVRPLFEGDRSQVIRLLEQSPEHNLYMLGNLTSIGFSQSDLCQYWGDFSEQGRLRAVLNRYMVGWSIYGESDADWKALGEMVDDYPTPARRLQDNPIGIPSFLPYVVQYTPSKLSVQTLMSLESYSFKPAKEREDITIRRATMADLPALVDFYADAEQMSRTAAGVEEPIQRTRLWFAERNGQICSAALTNAEVEQMAMIGGVYSVPERRGCGYSQAVCSALCADLLAEGKRPVLYWETPAAGAVYRHLGFDEVGDWRSVRF
ncbi:MAG: GNAT family N-acetyltransferase [Chloroflexota bacterium]